MSAIKVSTAKLSVFYVLNNLWLCDNIGRLWLPHLRFYFKAKRRLNLIQYLVQFKRLKHLIVVNSMENDEIVNLGNVLIASACP